MTWAKECLERMLAARRHAPGTRGHVIETGNAYLAYGAMELGRYAWWAISAKLDGIESVGPFQSSGQIVDPVYPPPAPPPPPPRRAPPPDLHRAAALLRVRLDADEVTLRRAYRRLVRRVHPDLNRRPDAAQRTHEARQAYDLLRAQARAFEPSQFPGHRRSESPSG